MDDSRVRDLLERWEELREQGCEPSAEELCREPSDSAEVLRQQIEALKSMDWLLEANPHDAEASDVVPADDQPSDNQPSDNVETLVHQPSRAAAMGRYRLQRLLGSGGFGEVWLAFDPELNRSVAVKIPRRDRATTSATMEHVLAEARKAALLKHPGIVPIYDVGREAETGCGFIVSQYLEGGDLARWIATRQLGHVEAVELVATLAETLHAAHQRGFIHRDVKPANILLDVAGRPYLTDFGIAVTAADPQCDSDKRSGTLAYMPPEQLQGRADILDARSDVYSLGVVLYELLTSHKPFRGQTPEKLMTAISEWEPRPPRQLDDSIPPELDTICLKALAKSPSQRYGTAIELAQDLRRFLASQQTLPKVPGQRQWLQAGLLAGLLVLVAIAPFVLRQSPPPSAPPTPLAAAAQQESHPAVSRAPTTGPVRAKVEVLVYEPQNGARVPLTLEQPGTLPLEAKDQIRIRVELSEPAYPYVVWIDSSGSVAPVYPWTPADWRIARSQKAVDSLALPEDPKERWPMRGAGGIETLLLLVRRSPLPADVEVEKLLAGLPPQPELLGVSLLRFEDGKLVDSSGPRLRGPDFKAPVAVADPLLSAQKAIATRLRPHFASIQALSFAFRGE